MIIGPLPRCAVAKDPVGYPTLFATVAGAVENRRPDLFPVSRVAGAVFWLDGHSVVSVAVLGVERIKAPILLPVSRTTGGSDSSA